MNEQRTLPRTIAVNGRFLGQPTTGVQRYAIELLRTLDGLLQRGSIPRVPVTVFTPAGTSTLPNYGFLQVRRYGRLSGALWEQVDLARAARGSLLFTPCGGAPVVHRDHAITIHDAGPFATPRAYTAAYRWHYKVLQRLLARSARQILTVSRFSQRELAHYLRVDQDRIRPIHVSGEHILRCPRNSDVLTRHGLTHGKYVLAVGSLNPNKNLPGVMRAARLLQDDRIQVAIVGGMNSHIFTEAEHLSDSVMLLGVVSDAELRTLYEDAGCMVFPSFYEGFGSPPLEALTLGCPVVAGRAASMPEVLGDAAVYCDPGSPEDIAAQIRVVMRGGGPSRAARLARAGTFSWERCARETWAVLLAAMGMHAESGAAAETSTGPVGGADRERLRDAG